MQFRFGFFTFQLVLLLVAAAAMAGPVADELARRDGDVGFPKPRPIQQSNATEPSEAQRPSLWDPEPDRENSDTEPLSDENTIVAKDTENPAPSACVINLSKKYSARPAAHPNSNDEGCTIPDPVELMATKGKFPVQFTKGLILNCSFATKLAEFVSDTVQPLARHHIGSPIIEITSGQGYVCRRRNNAAQGKLSEHALGNATDWVGFNLEDGRSLGVIEPGKMKADEARFFNAVRTAACGTFTTVLGPGSNEAHATHLHFDLGRTKEGKKNLYRICE